MTRDEALAASIFHWKQNVAAARSGDLDQFDYSGNACALCTKYRYDDAEDNETCRGCPVSKATGRKSCVGSPYEEVVKAEDDLEPGGDRSALIAACEAELAFLISLQEPSDDNA